MDTNVCNENEKRKLVNINNCKTESNQSINTIEESKIETKSSFINKHNVIKDDSETKIDNEKCIGKY